MPVLGGKSAPESRLYLFRVQGLGFRMAIRSVLWPQLGRAPASAGAWGSTLAVLLNPVSRLREIMLPWSLGAFLVVSSCSPALLVSWWSWLSCRHGCKVKKRTALQGEGLAPSNCFVWIGVTGFLGGSGFRGLVFRAFRACKSLNKSWVGALGLETGG